MQSINEVPKPIKAQAAVQKATFDDAIGSGLARSILDSSPDCIKLLSLEGSIVYMNENGLRAMEIDTFCGVKDRHWPSLWPDDVQDLLQSAIENANLGERTEFDACCPTARGSLYGEIN